MNKDREKTEFQLSDLLDPDKLVAVSCDFMGRYGDEFNLRFKEKEKVSQRGLLIFEAANVLIDRLGEFFPEFGKRVKKIDEEFLNEGEMGWSKNRQRITEWVLFLQRLDNLKDLLSK